MGQFDFLSSPASVARPGKAKPDPIKQLREEAAKQPASTWWIVGIGGLILLGWIGNALGITAPGESHAVVDARQHIQTMLNYPDTASFGWDKAVERFGNRGFAVTSTVQAKNAFGVTQTMPWTVRLRYDEKGQCEIISAWFHE